jgi:hypothetical protein
MFNTTDKIIKHKKRITAPGRGNVQGQLWATTATHSIATNPPWMQAALTRYFNSHSVSQTLPIG